MIYFLENKKQYFTECTVGYFGNNCDESCSMTCGDPGICNKVTGHCNGSCLAGWEGDMCEIGNYLSRGSLYHLKYILSDIYVCFLMLL